MDPNQTRTHIKYLLKKHNISLGVLAQYLEVNKPYVASLVRSASPRMLKDKYQLLLSAIESLSKMSDEEIYNKYIRGDVIKKREKPEFKNIKEIRSLLEEHNISLSALANKLNYTSSHLSSRIQYSSRKDISDNFKERLKKAIAEIVNNK